jgi:4-amino-4-deoxy-L-arabinose transferase-like glycosyltransferase
MSAPFLALTLFDPVGPSIMVALFGVATVILLYKFLKETTSFYPALMASLLYATAPLIVRYSRSSWNPNPLPFFSLLLIYFLYLGIKKNKLKYFLFAGLCFGIAIQLQYLSIMLIPVAALIVLINTPYRKWLQILLLGLAGAFITFSPFLLFEIKHNFPNFRTIFEFVTRSSTHGLRNPDIIYVISNTGNIFFEELSLLKATPVTRIVFWLLTLSGIFGLAVNWKNKKNKLIFSIGLVWFIGGLFFLRYYSGQLFDYYYGFMFPVPFLLLGLIISLIWHKSLGKIFSMIIVSIILAWFFSKSVFKSLPNRLINQTSSVADSVIEKSQGEPFNFALITDHNSDHAYRYFLEIKNHKPVELETMITEQLLIVCEIKDCRPLGYPSWEIAGFGRGEIAGVWEIPDIGIKVIRLTHWPGEPSPAGKPALKGN